MELKLLRASKIRCCFVHSVSWVREITGKPQHFLFDRLLTPFGSRIRCPVTQTEVYLQSSQAKCRIFLNIYLPLIHRICTYR